MFHHYDAGSCDYDLFGHPDIQTSHEWHPIFGTLPEPLNSQILIPPPADHGKEWSGRMEVLVGVVAVLVGIAGMQWGVRTFHGHFRIVYTDEVPAPPVPPVQPPEGKTRKRKKTEKPPVHIVMTYETDWIVAICFIITAVCAIITAILVAIGTVIAVWAF